MTSIAGVLGALVIAIAGTAWAQTVPPDSPPQIGQISKDSIWVPTPERMIRRMLQLADAGPGDVVIDLGSGDGRIPIYAAKHFGSRAIGVELEANLIAMSRRAAEDEGVSHLARFLRQDLFDADLSAATVVALYISPEVMSQLKPRLLSLSPGTRIVSHQFRLEGWEPDESVRTENRDGHLWVVPAAAHGTWTLRLPGEELGMRIQQRYQVLEIRGERGGRPVNFVGARLRGAEISFTSFDADGNARHYRGRMSGNRMEGESAGQDILPLPWRAERH